MTAALWAGVVVIGGVGAVLRFVIDRAVTSRVGGRFPFGTLAVNLSGALLDRLKLDEKRVEGIARAIDDVIALADVPGDDLGLLQALAEIREGEGLLGHVSS